MTTTTTTAYRHASGASILQEHGSYYRAPTRTDWTRDETKGVRCIAYSHASGARVVLHKSKGYYLAPVETWHVYLSPCVPFEGPTGRRLTFQGADGAMKAAEKAAARR